ncbi:MAG: tetratricopeptide repeat-containing sulfotransferase family protein [Steroidobacteraceae bacterium]
MKDSNRKGALDNAQSLLTAGQLDQAASATQALIENNTNDYRAWHLLSQVEAKRGRLVEALACIAHALELNPGHVGSRLQQGQYLIATGRRREALEVAVSLASTNLLRADWNDALGTLFTLCDEPSKALPLFQSAVTQAPNDIRYHYNLAAVQRMTGDLTEAEATLNSVIAKEPSNAYAYYTRADLRTQSPASNHVAEMIDALDKHVRHVGDRILLCYATGKELDDLGDYRLAFHYFKRGADAQRKLFTYNVGDDTAVITRMIEQHTPEVLAGATGFDSNESLFVFGLPRTGTTLVEQVLASHSDVFGAGELQAFPLAVINAAKELGGRQIGKSELVDLSLKIDPASLGRAYLEATRPQTGNTRHFVDKQPTNYLYAGLIGRALPHARFIVVVRDPLDGCFAMYRALFTGAYPFSYTLSELAIYYAAWHRLIRHWQTVLRHRLLVVRYEDLVQRFEETVHRMIEHCGLTWENQILSFHTHRRTVTTASASQVRRPIYASSVGKWRNYEEQLAPLIEALRRLEPSDGWTLPLAGSDSCDSRSTKLP